METNLLKPQWAKKKKKEEEEENLTEQIYSYS